MKKVNIEFKLDIMLFIIFLMLKLDGIIDWQWIWIFSPFWATWIVQLLIAAVVAIKNYEPKWKSYRVPSGSTLVWDPKTNTLHGPWEAEEE